MSKKLWIVIIVLALLGGGGYGAFWYVMHKPPAKTEDFKGEAPAIKTSDLAKEYAANETAADAKYLNKMLTLNGTVTEIEKNQEGGLTVMLESGDPAAPIQCGMQNKGVNIAKGQTITVMGKCTGNTITGVAFTGCIIK